MQAAEMRNAETASSSSRSRSTAATDAAVTGAVSAARRQPASDARGISPSVRLPAIA